MYGLDLVLTKSRKERKLDGQIENLYRCSVCAKIFAEFARGFEHRRDAASVLLTYERDATSYVSSNHIEYSIR
jgi:hypothetical protein